jgi:hypothetical protein
MNALKGFGVGHYPTVVVGGMPNCDESPATSVMGIIKYQFLYKNCKNWHYAFSAHLLDT